MQEDPEDMSIRTHIAQEVTIREFYRALSRVGLLDAQGHIRHKSCWAHWCHSWLHLLILDPEDQTGHEEILT
jgi:hypothetical protein